MWRDRGSYTCEIPHPWLWREVDEVSASCIQEGHTALAVNLASGPV